MNQTRRFLSVALLAALSAPGLAAETAIDQLYGLRQYELADAYYAAGQRFADLGQADRGAEFKAKALRLFPGYVPGQSPKAATVAVAAPTTPAPALPAVEAVREQNLQGQKIARLQFQKLLRGYLTSSASTVLAVLAPGLTVQGQAAAADRAAVSAFLEANPAEAGSPEELFVLDSLEVKDGPGTSVVVTVRAQEDAAEALSALLPFWKASQSYTFTRIGDTWKLSAIEGQ